MKIELAMYQALVAINVPELKATAVIEALENDMQSVLATKTDITDVKADITALKSDITALRAEVVATCSQLETKLTVRMGVMLSAFIGLQLAAMKYLAL
ncbi:hypothetical protein NUH87_28600 [Pseudomonas batumici]|uniref:hypothetical protein n=1 Tax=Pseudomonas batumici TaxID=226910 RepID=UPI0030CB02CA